MDRYGRQLFFLGPSVSGPVGQEREEGEIPVMPLMAFFGRSKLGPSKIRTTGHGSKRVSLRVQALI